MFGPEGFPHKWFPPMVAVLINRRPCSMGVPKVEREMAINLMCAVLDRGPDDLCEMAVMLALADGADKDTGETWPSHKTIAHRARQTDRSVRNVLKRLEEGGWVTWEKRLRGNGSQASNVYTLNLEKLGETPRQQPSKSPTATGAKQGEHRSPPPEHRSAPPRNGVHPPPERRSDHAPERRSALEPSQNMKPAHAPARHAETDGSNNTGQAISADDLTPHEQKMIREGQSFVLGGRGGYLVKPGHPDFDRLRADLEEKAQPRTHAPETVASHVHRSIGRGMRQPVNCHERGKSDDLAPRVREAMPAGL